MSVLKSLGPATEQQLAVATGIESEQQHDSLPVRIPFHGQADESRATGCTTKSTVNRHARSHRATPACLLFPWLLVFMALGVSARIGCEG